MNKITTVDDYITSAPEPVQAQLREMREIIREAAPLAEEKISYSMPYYGYKGRLVYFAFAKKHIGLYIPPPIIAQHAQELTSYKTSVSAVQFPLDKPLPQALITKLVCARVQFNDDKAKA